jgi:hypothetical protein
MVNRGRKIATWMKIKIHYRITQHCKVSTTSYFSWSMGQTSCLRWYMGPLVTRICHGGCNHRSRSAPACKKSIILFEVEWSVTLSHLIIDYSVLLIPLLSCLAHHLIWRKPVFFKSRRVAVGRVLVEVYGTFRSFRSRLFWVLLS